MVSKTARDLVELLSTVSCQCLHTLSTASSRTIAVSRRHYNDRSGVCFILPRLLQLTVVRHQQQRVQNAAARLVTSDGRVDHATPILRQLH